MKRYSQQVRLLLVSAALGAMVVGCRSSSSTPVEDVEARRAAIYSSDPGTVAPGTPAPRTASCPGKTYPDQCGSWEGVELKATSCSGTSQCSSEQRCFCHPIAFQVPAKLPVTKGNAGAGDATLTFRKAGTTLQKCVYHGNALIGRSGKQTGGDAYVLVSCTDQSKAGGAEKADWFSLQVLGGDSSKGPTEVSLRLGAPDAVNGVVQEEILYSGDPRISGAALHIPRGSTPPNQDFSFSVLPQPTVGSTIPNGDDPAVTTGYGVDVHATGVAQFAFADVAGAKCPRIDLPYSPAALAAFAGPGAERLLRARQITNLAGLISGARVLARTSDVTIDPVNHLVSFCVSHLSYYVTIGTPNNAKLTAAYLTKSPVRPCATVANCNAGEVCNGNCYVDLFATAPPSLIPNSPYILHLDFNNNGTTTWTAAAPPPALNVKLQSVTPVPSMILSTPAWSANVPQSLGADVAQSGNASFDVTVTSPETENDAILDLCLAIGPTPFGECFSWDPPHSVTSTGGGRVALVEVCDGFDNDGNGEFDDVNSNVATEPGKPCDNGQTGSCKRTGTYVCDGLFATTCDAPIPAQTSCGGCTPLSQQPNTACNTGQTVGPCVVPGLAQCSGTDAVSCQPQPLPTNACGGCATLAMQKDAACDTGQTVGSCVVPGVVQCDGQNAVVCAPQSVDPSCTFECTPGAVKCAYGDGVGCDGSFQTCCGSNASTCGSDGHWHTTCCPNGCTAGQCTGSCLPGLGLCCTDDATPTGGGNGQNALCSAAFNTGLTPLQGGNGATHGAAWNCTLEGNWITADCGACRADGAQICTNYLCGGARCQSDCGTGPGACVNNPAACCGP